MRIGIFGGCFNPPHNVHKNICLQLIEKNYLDKVIFVPTESSYNKNDLVSFKDRYNMLKIMIDKNKNLEVSNIAELGYIYTYQLLRYYKEKYPKDIIYFICGSDNLGEINTWKNYEEILKDNKLIVIQRNNDIINLLNEYMFYKENIVIANIKENNLSSTFIRKNIDNISNKYIDDKVYDYIKENKLYKET